MATDTLQIAPFAEIVLYPLRGAMDMTVAQLATLIKTEKDAA